MPREFVTDPGPHRREARGLSVSLPEQLLWLADRKLMYWGDIDTHGYLTPGEAELCQELTGSAVRLEQERVRFSLLEGGARAGRTRLTLTAVSYDLCDWSSTTRPLTTMPCMTNGPGPRPGLDITSPGNAKIKHLVALRRRRAREAAGVTLVEGYAELGLALSAGVRPRTLYYCPELAHGDPLGVLDRVSELGTEVVRVSRPVFAKVAYRESPDGWLAVVPTVGTDLDRLELGGQPLLLVCEGVEKPGNLGAILRTADAAGVTAVIATDPVTDWGNANLVRASKGAVFSVPVAAAPSGRALPWLAGHGLTLVAATPDGEVLLADADLTGPVAIAVGSETHGLSPAWTGKADVTVRIPMFGRADSLNVSAAAAIVVYEAVRQRTLLARQAGRPAR